MYHLIAGQVDEDLSQHPGNCGLCSMVRLVNCDDDEDGNGDEDDDLGNVLVLSLGEIVHSLNISPVE